jgi:ketosteroid isomerase-like protein
MSQRNLEIVRRVYEDGLFDNDHQALLDLVHHEIRFVNPDDALEPGVRSGRDEFLGAMASGFAPFRSATHELVDLVDSGDSVIAVVRFHGLGRDSGIGVGQDEVHTWTFRDGKVACFEWGRDLAAALKAVGREE